jgi:hypothetical protein
MRFEIKMTYRRADDSWSVWFVPWCSGTYWKLLGTFTCWEDANEFMCELAR